MKKNYEKSWKDVKVDTMTWEEYFKKSPLHEVIKKVIDESFKKRER